MLYSYITIRMHRHKPTLLFVFVFWDHSRSSDFSLKWTRRITSSVKRTKPVTENRPVSKRKKLLPTLLHQEGTLSSNKRRHDVRVARICNSQKKFWFLSFQMRHTTMLAGLSDVRIFLPTILASGFLSRTCRCPSSTCTAWRRRSGSKTGTVYVVMISSKWMEICVGKEADRTGGEACIHRSV